MTHRMLTVFALVISPAPVIAQDANPKALEHAIAEMRNLPARLEGKEAEERGPRIQAAWETLIGAKAAGVAALLAEAARLESSKARDDRFRLGAAAVVWQIGHLDRVADVLTLWGDADFAVKYSYAFPCGFEAALDGDERALPILTALLRDQRGTYFVSSHVMELGWPLTHAFLWGPMGRKAVPALRTVLATTKDPIVTSSAIRLLADCWDVDTLPTMRAFASDRRHAARLVAISALGKFGHPDDFDLLCAGLGEDDIEVRKACIRALCAFGDLRAAEKLVPLAKSADDDLRDHVILGLAALPTVDGLEVFDARTAELGAEERAWFSGEPSILDNIEMTWDTFRALDRRARNEALTKAHLNARARLRIEAGDRQLTREQFEKACSSWIAASRITDEQHEWVAARHLLAVTKVADVPLLLDLRGSLFRRLSDECLEEVQIVDTVLAQLVRSQYRKEPGPCEHVERPSGAGK